jgi:hypothetical protein
VAGGGVRFPNAGVFVHTRSAPWVAEHLTQVIRGRGSRMRGATQLRIPTAGCNCNCCETPVCMYLSRVTVNKHLMKPCPNGRHHPWRGTISTDFLHTTYVSNEHPEILFTGQTRGGRPCPTCTGRSSFWSSALCECRSRLRGIHSSCMESQACFTVQVALLLQKATHISI